VDWLLDVQLLAFGLLAGILSGLLGIGGGVIYVLVLPPILISLGVTDIEIVAFTVANSLFATIFTTISGNIKQVTEKNFYLKPILYTSIPGVIVSFFLLHFFVNTRYYSKEIFNVVFVLVVFYLMIKLLLRIQESFHGTSTPLNGTGSTSAFLFTGLAAGVVSPLTGLGGGLVVVPIFHSILNFPIKQANSISLGVIGITAVFSSIVNMIEVPESNVLSFHLGYIVFPIVFFLSIGGIVGAFLGVELAKKLSPFVISVLFAAFLILVLSKKLMEIFS